MESFIRHTLSQLEQYARLDGFVYVVPNRRSVSAVYSALAEKIQAPIWAPKCLTIDELFERIAGYKLLSATDQLFELHKVYNSAVSQAERLTLKAFQSYGKLLLQDFNDIDLSLSDPEMLFKELKQLIELDSTFAPEEQTELMRSHLNRVRRISAVYRALVAHCDSQKRAYQGLLYKRAYEQLSAFVESQQTPFVFIGFNAFSKAEQEVVKAVLTRVSESRIFWDIDWDLLQDDQHESGLFIRRYRAEWNFLEKQRPFCVFKENNALFHKERQLEIIEAPGVLAQVHALNALLESKESFENTAVILADENLLEAVMNSVSFHAEKGPINITMGNGLSHTPTAELIRSFIALRQSISDDGSQVSAEKIKHFTQHPLQRESVALVLSETESRASRIRKSSLQQNKYMAYSEGAQHEWALLIRFLEGLDTTTSDLMLTLMKAHEHRVFESTFEENALDRIEVLFNELIATQKITFKGDPKAGLQLMGILETRNLQFETVIVLSLNEKIIPKGRSYGSLLPYDLRRSYDIPTYKEKDAIYTYYFYRLLQGASRAHLLYNSQLGAFETKEKSRLLYQLELEPRLEKQIIYRSVYFNQSFSLDRSKQNLLPKSTSFLEAVRAHFKNGLSVSSLLAYLHEPTTFYSRYLLQLSETRLPSDRMEANLLGTLIHDSLDALYAPHTQKPLSLEQLNAILTEIKPAIGIAYDKNQLSTEAENGRSILIYDVIEAYVTAVVQADRETLEKGSTLRILSLEETYFKELPQDQTQKLGLTTVKLKGKIDRIDEVDGALRITDYKTGSVSTSDATFKQLEDALGTKKQKVFQLLFYNYLLFDHAKYSPYFEGQQVSASIFSTKNNTHYYLSQEKTPFSLNSDTFKDFEVLLMGLISEIHSGETLDLTASD
jgi:RecB family exonuclease